MVTMQDATIRRPRMRGRTQGGPVDGVEPLGSPRYFEIHVPEMVFVAKNVRQNYDFIILFDKAHGNPGDRRLSRYPGVHQGKRSATDRSHR